jgi:hypothetical protein
MERVDVVSVKKALDDALGMRKDSYWMWFRGYVLARVSTEEFHVRISECLENNPHAAILHNKFVLALLHNGRVVVQDVRESAVERVSLEKEKHYRSLREASARERMEGGRPDQFVPKQMDMGEVIEKSNVQQSGWAVAALPDEDSIHRKMFHVAGESGLQGDSRDAATLISQGMQAFLKDLLSTTLHLKHVLGTSAPKGTAIQKRGEDAQVITCHDILRTVRIAPHILGDDAEKIMEKTMFYSCEE